MSYFLGGVQQYWYTVYYFLNRFSSTLTVCEESWHKVTSNEYKPPSDKLNWKSRASYTKKKLSAVWQGYMYEHRPQTLTGDTLSTFALWTIPSSDWQLGSSQCRPVLTGVRQRVDMSNAWRPQWSTAETTSNNKRRRQKEVLWRRNMLSYIRLFESALF